MSVRVGNIQDLTVHAGLSVILINGLVANKFSEIIQELLIDMIDQLEFYVIIWMLLAFAFYQFQSAYIYYARKDDTIDRFELLMVKVIDLVNLILVPAIAGVVSRIVISQSSTTEIATFDAFVVGILIVIIIFIFSSQTTINEIHSQYASRRFIARRN
jgi:hypothetical protein